MDDILKKALERTEREERERGKETPGRQAAGKPGTTASRTQKTAAPSPAFPGQAGKNAGKTGKPAPATEPARSRSSRKVELQYDVLEENKIVYDCRRNPVADQVKILRTQLLHRLLNLGGNSVFFTSPRPGEGKTVNAINTAFSIAQEVERTVLLIDANLRNPTIHKYLGLPDGPGLADYLLGRAEISDILVNPGIDKLTLLPGGQPLATSSEMLGASRMADLVNEMKNRYDDRILVFDGPDVLTNADSQVFSHLVDGVVLVVEAEKTTRQDVEQALERLGDTKLIGTIFNKCQT